MPVSWSNFLLRAVQPAVLGYYLILLFRPNVLQIKFLALRAIQVSARSNREYLLTHE